MIELEKRTAELERRRGNFSDRLIKYGLLFALISVAIATIMSSNQNQIARTFEKVSQKIR